ncbi:MAG: FAD-dependent tricarballylate dehydrogenase TcuA [Betaproteobacteria bacterium]
MNLEAIEPDVLVAGGGNAALVAALTAREAGASVLLLEGSPREWRGGNSQHTRNMRCMHEAPQDVLTDAYPEQEYWEDLARVTGGNTDERLAHMAIRGSSSVRPWMMGYGIRFQHALGGTLHLSRTNAFFLGGGKALVNAYYRAAHGIGVKVAYEAGVEDVEMDGERFVAAIVRHEGRVQRLRARTLVAAAGGFESNREWLREAWGPAADNFVVRGTRFNQGRVLKALLARGVQPVADPLQGHMVAVDARAPTYDGGIVTRVDCVSLGIVVNRDGERFYDEGEDFWPKRYAIWGRLVANQPGQVAYSIIDSKALGRFMPPVFPGETADNLPQLAAKLGLDAGALTRTVERFNAATRPGHFDHTALDDCRTEGLTPAKTHWARPIDTPPYFGFALCPGVTFTYLGVKVDERAQVGMASGRTAPNLFAAGEIMAGNILGRGYLAGIGMTIGTVFGRIAGMHAAQAARGAAT